jgi:bifunctional polynucleotide phosphatase/kinase
LEIVVLVGIPGSGKTTLALSSFPEHHRINLDTLHTRSREDEEIGGSLSRGEDIIIDNTNTTKKSRSKYVKTAKLFGATVRAVYLKCPIEIALKRNAMREGKGRVPDGAVRFYNKTLQPPSKEEGFDEVEVVEVSDNS